MVRHVFHDAIDIFLGFGAVFLAVVICVHCCFDQLMDVAHHIIDREIFVILIH